MSRARNYNSFKNIIDTSTKDPTSSITMNTFSFPFPKQRIVNDKKNTKKKVKNKRRKRKHTNDKEVDNSEKGINSGKNNKSDTDKLKKQRLKASPETVKINKSIAIFASRKQLQEAVDAFNLAKQRGIANLHTYATTINAYVRCGDVGSAEKLLHSMKTIDIVSYTTVIKGMCNEGKLNEALNLAHKMYSNNVIPNVRTGNTLLRGCILIGKISKALDILHDMEKKWQVVPDASSWEYVIALLCRGLKIDVVNTMVGRLKGKTNNDLAICNNPALYLCMCRCNAILGRWKAAKKAGNKALVFLEHEEAEEGKSASGETSDGQDVNKNTHKTQGGKRGWGSQASSHTRNESLKVFKQHRRQEMREELQIMLKYVQFQKGKTISTENQIKILISFLKRTCVIPLIRNTTTPQSNSSSLTSSNGHIDNKKENYSTFPAVLCRGLYEGFGLKVLIAKYSHFLDEKHFLNHFENILIDDTSEKINLKNLLVTNDNKDNEVDEDSRPIKVEICSGAGEWVVSQAKHDPGSDWVSMEIRHDRIYQIFCRSMFDSCNNLSIIGGDASKILPNHFPSNCVKYIFVNYPEPPQQKGEDHDSQSSHLLSESFFKSMAQVLTIDGIMTILTDNEWYAKYLLKIVDGLRHVIKSSSIVGNNKDYEVCERSRNNMVLYEGLPGNDCGVANISASSYFDRLWQGHQQRRRFFLVLSKK
jgi:pentatricopeptide repeat protein